jgi:DNA uptake protein ComE-like DNA-binding protein
MRMRRVAEAWAFCGLVAFGSGLLTGCGSWFEHDNPTAEKQEEQKQRDEKTRDEVAKATEKAKPIVQEAGRELGEAARTAAESAKAAAEGVREGWERGKDAPLDLNAASENELAKLPGISKRTARKIVAGRPYKSPHEMVSKRILTEDEYSGIKAEVTVK